MDNKRCIKLLAVILSLSLLVLCLCPVLGCCHNCRDDDCVICRAVCSVSRLMKTAGLFPASFAIAVYIILRLAGSEKRRTEITASSPVELHTVIIS